MIEWVALAALLVTIGCAALVDAYAAASGRIGCEWLADVIGCPGCGTQRCTCGGAE